MGQSSRNEITSQYAGGAPFDTLTGGGGNHSGFSCLFTGTGEVLTLLGKSDCKTAEEIWASRMFTA